MQDMPGIKVKEEEEMSRSTEFAKSKMKHIGSATCNVCSIRKKDVVQVEKSWFTSINICDSCGRELFRLYRKELKGVAGSKPTIEGD